MEGLTAVVGFLHAPTSRARRSSVGRGAHLISAGRARCTCAQESTPRKRQLSLLEAQSWITSHAPAAHAALAPVVEYIAAPDVHAVCGVVECIAPASTVCSHGSRGVHRSSAHRTHGRPKTQPAVWTRFAGPVLRGVHPFTRPLLCERMAAWPWCLGAGSTRVSACGARVWVSRHRVPCARTGQCAGLP